MCTCCSPLVNSYPPVHPIPSSVWTTKIFIVETKNIFELCDKGCENVVSALLFGRCPAELRRVRAAVPADDAARVAAAAAQRVLPLHRRRRGPRHRALHHGLRAAGL